MSAAEQFLPLFPELASVSNQEWVERACQIWIELLDRSTWESLEEIPFALDTSGRTLLTHTRATVGCASRVADDMMQVYPIRLHKDWILLAAFLHDVSKILEYAREGGETVRSREGQVYQHAFLGAHYALEMGLPEEVVSIIMCHTPQSNVKMKFLEGVIVMHVEAAVSASRIDYEEMMGEGLGMKAEEAVYQKYLQWFPELARVENRCWAEAACAAWEKSVALSQWASLADVPFHPDPARGMLLQHLQITTRIAVDMAEAIQEICQIPVDMDVVILSAILHDLSKPNEFVPKKVGYGKSRLAHLYQHGVLGAHIALELDFPPEIVSIIISHTRQSNFDVKSLEGQLICQADDIAAGTFHTYLSPLSI